MREKESLQRALSAILRNPRPLDFERVVALVWVLNPSYDWHRAEDEAEKVFGEARHKAILRGSAGES